MKVIGYPNTDNEIDWDKWLSSEIIWWPWPVAVSYYERKTGLRMTKEHLISQGRAGHFKYGVAAKSPGRLAPVDRGTFQPWVDGSKKK